MEYREHSVRMREEREKVNNSETWTLVRAPHVMLRESHNLILID